MAERIPALDATFLELEEADPGAHMHIGAVMVFEPPPTGRAPRIEEVRALLESRLGELPRFRQRLSEPRTGGLVWPEWTDDDRFSIARHVRRASIPVPGGEAELLDWAGDFFSQRLDRSRPLWEMVVIEGLAGGRWAMATKTHHCLVDGVGSVDAGRLMLDSGPGDAAPGQTSRQQARGHASDAASRSPLSRAVGTGVTLASLPLRVARGGYRLVAAGASVASDPGRAAEVAQRARAMATVILEDELSAAPSTSLNVPIGTRRRLAVTCVPLDELKEVKRSLGGTVNDVVLAVAAGGLRKLLIERGDPLPQRGLRAMVPVNIRTAGEALSLGNRITSLFVHLPVADEEPLTRYLHQVEEAEELKSGTQALGSSVLLDLTGHAPPVLHSFLARSLFATRLFNVTITNIPGPQLPLYSFGSRMTDVWPLVPLASEHAVGLAVFSYDGKVFFAYNADPDTVPDLDLLSRATEDAFAELREITFERA